MYRKIYHTLILRDSGLDPCNLFFFHKPWTIRILFLTNQDLMVHVTIAGSHATSQVMDVVGLWLPYDHCQNPNCRQLHRPARFPWLGHPQRPQHVVHRLLLWPQLEWADSSLHRPLPGHPILLDRIYIATVRTLCALQNSVWHWNISLESHFLEPVLLRFVGKISLLSIKEIFWFL